MKKTIAMIFVLVLCLSLCACGGKETAQKLNLGETASTDIVDFTLHSANFAFFASATTNSTYLSATDDNTLYGASIGKILMLPSFTMTNKDRAGSISVCGGDWPFNWTVNYGGTEHSLYGFDLNLTDVTVQMSPGCVIDPLTEYSVSEYKSSNYLLDAGESVSMRIITTANFEPSDLGDAFELKISLPSSSGNFEDFIYIIPDADDPLTENQLALLYDKVAQLIALEKYYPALKYLGQLGDYKDCTTLYDFCIRHYAVQAGMYGVAEEYLKENMNGFPQITGEVLREIIPGNSWYLQGVGSNEWEFFEDGTIDDHWGNDRKWLVESDLLVLRFKNNDKKLTVLEVYDGGYVLLENSEYYATFYKVAEQ